MPSTSSSPEPLMRANHPNPAPRCQTVRASNGRQCVWHKELCDANEGHHDGIQSFSDAEAEPKDTLPRGGAEGVHVHEWGEWRPGKSESTRDLEYAYCPCGASKARRAELEKPQELEAERWKTGRCRDCEEPIPQGCTLCQACADKPVCTHCQGPHALEDCKGLEEPEEGGCAHEAWEERNRSSRGRVSRWCIACGHYMGRFDAEPAPMPIPRRPPYAVAYAVEGGAQYEVAVSGDATVVAEDGALHILHPKKPVLAIVRVTPMNMEEEAPDGDGS